MNVPKLRFKEFNDEWIEKRLSDISTLTSSKRIYLSDYVNSGIPFYRGKEITELKRNLPVSDILYITESKYNEIKSKYGVPIKDDILITGVGTLGNVYRVSNNSPFYFKDGNLIWLKEIKEDSSFLEKNLEYGKKKILDSAIGSTQKALTIVELSKLKFSFPQIKEQLKVANLLSLLDKKIELQTKKIEDLKLFKKGLDQSIFNNKTLFKQELFKNLFDSDGGTALEEYISKDGTHKIISIGNYSTNGLYIDNGQRITLNDKTKTKLLDKDNLVMILNDKTISGDIIGSTILIDKDNHYIYNQRSQKLICKNIDPKYAWCFLNSNTFRKRIFQLSQGGTQIYVNFPTIEKETINIPKDENISNLIINSIFSIYKKIELENDKLDKLQQLKKGLMQNMFV